MVMPIRAGPRSGATFSWEKSSTLLASASVLQTSIDKRYRRMTILKGRWMRHDVICRNRTNSRKAETRMECSRGNVEKNQECRILARLQGLLTPLPPRINLQLKRG